MSYRILLVDPDVAASVVVENAMTEAGYRVAAVSRFADAIRQISLDCPDLLVTVLRLEAFNGLHLLLRLRENHPGVPVIIVGDLADFTSDIVRYGARFVVTPIDRAALLVLVAEQLVGRTPRDPKGDRRWPRKTAGLPATVLETSARVVELSYGGLRLEMPGAPGDVDAPLDIRLPTLGVSVKAVARWSKAVDGGGAWWCGAEIAPAGSGATRTWRWIVDSLN